VSLGNWLPKFKRRLTVRLETLEDNGQVTQHRIPRRTKASTTPLQKPKPPYILAAYRL
jgi:hypothetical protein